ADRAHGRGAAVPLHAQVRHPHLAQPAFQPRGGRILFHLGRRLDHVLPITYAALARPSPPISSCTFARMSRGLKGLLSTTRMFVFASCSGGIEKPRAVSIIAGIPDVSACSRSFVHISRPERYGIW